MSETLLRYEVTKQAQKEKDDLKKVVKLEGLKDDAGKQLWFALPLEILHPLADVMAYGEGKYGLRNCLNPFTEPDRRFFDAAMRHLESCQKDPLAKDPESGCYHAASVAFSMLMMIYHCERTGK